MIYKKNIREIQLKIKELEKEFNKKLVDLGNESEKPVMFITIPYVSLNFKGSLHKKPIQIKVKLR